jgi:hypothetical protein
MHPILISYEDIMETPPRALMAFRAVVERILVQASKPVAHQEISTA